MQFIQYSIISLPNLVEFKNMKDKNKIWPYSSWQICLFTHRGIYGANTSTWLEMLHLPEYLEFPVRKFLWVVPIKLKKQPIWVAYNGKKFSGSREHAKFSQNLGANLWHLCLMYPQAFGAYISIWCIYRRLLQKQKLFVFTPVYLLVKEMCLSAQNEL